MGVTVTQPPRPRKPARSGRGTLKITLALLAGAVVTWAVAWGCALWGPRPMRRGEVQVKGEAAVQRARENGLIVPGDFGDSTFNSEVHSAPGYQMTFVGFITVEHPRTTSSQRVFACDRFVRSTGWPLLGLRGTLRAEQGEPLRRTGILLVPSRVARVLHTRGEQPRLPCVPIPLGFTLNTLLAAGVILMLTEGAGARRKRGRCPWCGYDRAGAAGGAACPECGRV